MNVASYLVEALQNKGSPHLCAPKPAVLRPCRSLLFEVNRGRPTARRNLDSSESSASEVQQ